MEKFTRSREELKGPEHLGNEICVCSPFLSFSFVWRPSAGRFLLIASDSHPPRSAPPQQKERACFDVMALPQCQGRALGSPPGVSHSLLGPATGVRGVGVTIGLVWDPCIS